MSYDYRYTQRRTTNTGNRPGARRGFYGPPPPPTRGNASHQSLFGYWVPLVVTGTIAIGGLAAWIWSERSERDEDDYPHDKPPRPQTGVGGAYPTQGSQPYPGPPPPQAPDSQFPLGQGGYPPQQAGPPPPPPPGGEASTYYNTTSESRDVSQQQDATWYGRASGLMKRTPSPQQFFDSASKQVGAGFAAAGAALGSIMEGGSDEEVYDNRRRDNRKRVSRDGRADERQEVFSDHERWSEEADEKQRVVAGAVEAESERRADVARAKGKERGRGRKSVAVVVSADTSSDVGYDDDATYRTEHASILSHLPSQHASTSETTDLFVLMYAPGLKSLPPLSYQPNTSGPGSSYSQISTPAVTPGSELQSMSPRVDAADAPSKQFDALYAQALALVSSPEQILPFTTPDGYVHILRHLAPQLVYISDALAGDEGEGIAQLKGWVGHTVLVAGDQGHGGLADTETEDEQGDGGRRERRRWYEESDFVGLGKDVEVVDAVRVGEDWSRRVGGRE